MAVTSTAMTVREGNRSLTDVDYFARMFVISRSWVRARIR